MLKNTSDDYIGVDLFNLRFTEDIACSLTTQVGTPDGTGPKVLLLSKSLYSNDDNSNTEQ
jgi:hypothetical protein